MSSQLARARGAGKQERKAGGQPGSSEGAGWRSEPPSCQAFPHLHHHHRGPAALPLPRSIFHAGLGFELWAPALLHRLPGPVLSSLTVETKRLSRCAAGQSSGGGLAQRAPPYPSSTGRLQLGYQLATGAVTMAIAIAGGTAAAYLLSCGLFGERALAPVEMFDDSMWFMGVEVG